MVGADTPSRCICAAGRARPARSQLLSTSTSQPCVVKRYRRRIYRAPGEYIVHLTVFDNGIGDGDGDGDASATDFDDPCNQTPPNFSCPNILTDETDALDGSSSQPKDVKVVCPA